MPASKLAETFSVANRKVLPCLSNTLTEDIVGHIQEILEEILLKKEIHEHDLSARSRVVPPPGQKSPEKESREMIPISSNLAKSWRGRKRRTLAFTISSC